MTDDLEEGQSALDAAYSKNRDRGADTAAPETQDAPKAEADAPKGDEAREPKDETRDPFKEYRDPDTKRLVPLTELKTEREKRQEQARLREEAERRASNAEAALAEARRYAEQFQRQQNQQQQFQQPQHDIPDPITDPEAYREYVHRAAVSDAHRLALSERLNTSQMLAEEKFGAEKVEAALKVAAQVGVLQSFIETRNPYGELMKWHAKTEAMTRIGDPTDFEKRVREEERQKVLAELKQGSANSQQRFPGTLADVPASGAQGDVPLSDQQMLDAAFASGRRRR